jgi:hypothetical protein
MSDLRQFDDRIWDRFFDFVYPCEPRRSREEVQVELRRLGINVRSAVDAVLQAIESAKARAQLAAAKQRRVNIGATLGQVVPPPPEGLRSTLRQLIAQRFGSSETAAHWYKLEKEASDEDLRSLLSDMQLLETFSEDPENGGSPSK